MEASGRKSSVGRIIALGINLALIVFAAWVFVNRQEVFDRISLLGYTPSSEVIELADASTMTDESRRYFYASRPEVNDRSAFSKNCSNDSEETIVLGCYAARRIYIFNVTDERLPGVKAVTASHEMLHAAYERLGSNDKARVEGMLRAEMSTINDERIAQLADTYNKTEPGQVLNEMHSILATEVSSLSPELENYYSQYFTDRQAVVALSGAYERVFSDLRTQQETLAAELNGLADSINQRSAALNEGVGRLNADVDSFNRRAQANQFSTRAQFDSERTELLERQQQLQAERSAIEGMIARYDGLKQQLDAINLEAQSLNTSINSGLDSVPSVE